MNEEQKPFLESEALRAESIDLVLDSKSAKVTWRANPSFGKGHGVFVSQERVGGAGAGRRKSGQPEPSQPAVPGTRRPAPLPLTLLHPTIEHPL